MSKEESFLTIKQNGDNLLTIKKSKFIASLARTTTVDQAKEFILKIQKKYHDATHNTYAYTIGLHDDQVKASDNGEPSGTAGVPELKALQLMNLKNITVVVTRYFGGIKLGAGGLIRAYSNSVTEAVHQVGVVRVSEQQELVFHIPYNQLDSVDHYLSENNIFVSDHQYGQDITISVFLADDDLNTFETDLTNLLAGKISFNKGDRRKIEVPVNLSNYHEA